MLDEVRHILASIDLLEPEHSHLAPTALYNEGWMLRLTLDAMERYKVDHPFGFKPGARWFSEAMLDSPFLTRKLSPSNGLAESHTHADGVVGHFEFRPGTATGLSLKDGAAQFVVCEAKLFSPLGEGVTNAPNFDQAARYVACMAETLSRRFPEGFPPGLDVGFYLLAPREQIDGGVFDAKMTRESIEAAIADRILDYRDVDPDRHSQLSTWEVRHLRPLLDHLGSTLPCVSWESVIEAIRAKQGVVGGRLADIYARCLVANRSSPNRAIPVIGGRPVSGGYYQILEGDVPVVVRVIRMGHRNSRIARADGVGPPRKVPNETLSPIADLAVPIGGGGILRLQRGGLYHWTDACGTIQRVVVVNVGPANSRVRHEGDETSVSFLVPNHTLTPFAEGHRRA